VTAVIHPGAGRSPSTESTMTLRGQGWAKVTSVTPSMAAMVTDNSRHCARTSGSMRR